MPIHDQGYRRYGGARAPAGRAWSVIARAGIRTLLGKRAFIALLLLSWIPFLVRAVQIYAATNLPQAAMFCRRRQDVPAVSRAAGSVPVLHHGLRRRRPHRHRSPRQCAADLPVEAVDATGVHLRQARHPDDVPAPGHLGAGAPAARRPDPVLGQLRVLPRQPVSVPGDHAVFRSSRSSPSRSRCSRSRRCRRAAATSACSTPA